MSGECSVFPFSVNFGTLKCVLRGLSHFCHYKYFSIQLKSSTLTCSSSVMSCLHGGGGYGAVWKGIWKPGGNLVAIKKVMQPVEREVGPMISMQKLVETVVSMLCMLEVHRSCIQDSTQQTRYTKYNNTGEDPACSKWNVPMTSNSMELSLIHLVLETALSQVGVCTGHRGGILHGCIWWHGRLGNFVQTKTKHVKMD